MFSNSILQEVQRAVCGLVLLDNSSLYDNSGPITKCTRPWMNQRIHSKILINPTLTQLVSILMQKSKKWNVHFLNLLHTRNLSWSTGIVLVVQDGRRNVVLRGNDWRRTRTFWAVITRKLWEMLTKQRAFVLSSKPNLNPEEFMNQFLKRVFYLQGTRYEGQKRNGGQDLQRNCDSAFSKTQINSSPSYN